MPTACKVSLITPYDHTLKLQIIDVQKRVDHLYFSLLDTKLAEREYTNYASTYTDIEVLLSSILKQNQVKPLNENAVAVSKIALSFWRKYKAEHKAEGTLSNGLIKINNKYMSDILYAMQVSEEGKKISVNNDAILKE